VFNLPHAHVQPAAVHSVNICCIEELILGNRRITVDDIASNSGTNDGCVETIIHEHLLHKKVYAWWVPKMLTSNRNVHNVAVSVKHLPCFEFEGNTFLEHIVICDEMWAHYSTSESEQSSMEWHCKRSPPSRKSETQLLAGKNVLGFRRSDSYWFSSTWYKNECTVLQQLAL
jgi:hypothetical protein